MFAILGDKECLAHQARLQIDRAAVLGLFLLGTWVHTGIKMHGNYQKQHPRGLVAFGAISLLNQGGVGMRRSTKRDP